MYAHKLDKYRDILTSYPTNTFIYIKTTGVNTSSHP